MSLVLHVPNIDIYDYLPSRRVYHISVSMFRTTKIGPGSFTAHLIHVRTCWHCSLMKHWTTFLCWLRTGVVAL